MTRPFRWLRTTCKQNSQGATRRFSGKPQASAHARGYGVPWRRLRQLKLNRDPLCEHCKARGIINPGEQVDHIVPLSEGGEHDLANLQTLCGPCHWAKTRRDVQRRRRTARSSPGG